MGHAFISFLDPEEEYPESNSNEICFEIAKSTLQLIVNFMINQNPQDEAWTNFLKGRRGINCLFVGEVKTNESEVDIGSSFLKALLEIKCQFEKPKSRNDFQIYTLAEIEDLIAAYILLRGKNSGHLMPDNLKDLCLNTLKRFEY